MRCRSRGLTDLTKQIINYACIDVTIHVILEGSSAFRLALAYLADCLLEVMKIHLYIFSSQVVLRMAWTLGVLPTAQALAAVGIYGMLDKGEVYMTPPVRPEIIAIRPTRAARCAPHSHAMPAYACTREVFHTYSFGGMHQLALADHIHIIGLLTNHIPL